MSTIIHTRFIIRFSQCRVDTKGMYYGIENLRSHVEKQLKKLNCMDEKRLKRILEEVDFVFKWISPESLVEDYRQMESNDIAEGKSEPERKPINIIILAHGNIKNNLVSANDYFLSDAIESITFYAPWNCKIDSTAAMGILTCNLKPTEVEYWRLEYDENLQPYKKFIHKMDSKQFKDELPDRWNTIHRKNRDTIKIPDIILSPVEISSKEWEQTMEMENIFDPPRVHDRTTLVFPYIGGDKEHISYLSDIIVITSICFHVYRRTSNIRFHVASCLNGELTNDIRDLLEEQYACTPVNSVLSCSLKKLDKSFDLPANKTKVEMAQKVYSKFFES